MNPRPFHDSLFKAVCLSAPDMIVIADQNHLIYSLNATAEKRLGFQGKDLEGRPLESLFVRPGQFLELNLGEGDGTTEPKAALWRTQDRGQIEVQLWGRRLDEPSRTDFFLVVWARPLSDSDRTQKEVQEKDLLIKEIHHRVKNNMQVVTSLLSLQAHSTRDERIKEALKESQNRVQAMGMVHEILYQSGASTVVDIQRYLTRLAETLYLSFGGRERGIELRLNLESHMVPLDQAVPCGLILNELMSNALKHAFPGKRPGIIRLSMNKEKSDGMVVCLVEDDGVGMSENFDWRQSQTLGLTLVTNLVEKQLQGRLEVKRGAGTRFLLHLPILKDR